MTGCAFVLKKLVVIFCDKNILIPLILKVYSCWKLIVYNNCDNLVCYLVKMKIKMPCKLCELSIDQQQKLGFSNCNHTTFLSQTSPISSLPISSNLQNSSLFMPPIREMMLAAYLFRGEFSFYANCLYIYIKKKVSR